MKKLTEKQELEIWIRQMWNHAHLLEDEILKWLAEKYPQFFKLKDNMFSLKKFKTTLTL